MDEKIVHSSMPLIKDFFERSDKGDLCKMIDFIQCLKNMNDLIGKHNLNEFIVLLQGDDIELALTCSKIYRVNRNISDLEKNTQKKSKNVKKNENEIKEC
tara:strand:- start:162 stop:461 length:300 start_codon:yes stop_codon:yes gene_type:complete